MRVRRRMRRRLRDRRLSVALITCTWPTAQTGARSQAPMQGARTTRTSGPSVCRQDRCSRRSAPRHRAGQRIADPHGDRRRRRLALLHHVEMRVEGRDLVDLGHAPASSRRRARRDARRRDGRTCPGSDADARSAGRAGASGRRAARAPRRAPADRPGGPWACGAACGRAAGAVRRRRRRRILDVHRRSPMLRIEPFPDCQTIPSGPIGSIDILYRIAYDC